MTRTKVDAEFSKARNAMRTTKFDHRDGGSVYFNKIKELTEMCERLGISVNISEVFSEMKNAVKNTR